MCRVNNFAPFNSFLKAYSALSVKYFTMIQVKWKLGLSNAISEAISKAISDGIINIMIEKHTNKILVFTIII